jgi:hypothetical protein
MNTQKMVTVGQVRTQAALKAHETPVVIRVGKRYYRAVAVWPDTGAAPAGEGLYFEAAPEPFMEKG